jgi:hypothetical protein
MEHLFVESRGYGCFLSILEILMASSYSMGKQSGKLFRVICSQKSFSRMATTCVDDLVKQNLQNG